MGSVGRIVISDDSSDKHEMFLDLKGMHILPKFSALLLIILLPTSFNSLILILIFPRVLVSLPMVIFIICLYL